MTENTQNTETPQGFINAVQNYFGIEFAYDLAASKENTKARVFTTEEEDSLSMLWPLTDWSWLNPPFKNLTQWVNKCAEQQKRGCRIISIWPLSSDLNQIPAFQNADVYVIHKRVWKGVRGCMVCVWHPSSGGKVVGLRWDLVKLKRIW